MDQLQGVCPVRPLAGYIGGKRNLAGRLTTLIDAIPHDRYAEPFVGMGGVFFRRTRRPKAEFINDISRDVTTLFRVAKRHHAAFVAELQGALVSRDEFERLRSIDPETLTDIERAARFLYLQRIAFGGKVEGRNLGVSYDLPANFRVAELERMLAAARDRLDGVAIERLPYAKFIARYDRPGTLFYLDPPYFACENDYGPGVFERSDFARLAGQLAGIRGDFLMSINDRPEIRETFAGFAIAPVRTTYRISGAAQPVGELIIAGGSGAIATIEALKRVQS